MCIADASAGELGMYPTMDEAAIAALSNVQQQKDADKYEYMGVIYQDPESQQYAYTEPKGTGRRAKTGGTFKFPQGSARALYHNHPGEDGDELRQLFSEDDIDTAKRTGLKSYIDYGIGIAVWNPKKPGQIKKEGTGLRARKMGVGTPVPYSVTATLAINQTTEEK